MYSMVLMAALTSGGTTPECHWFSCHGCSGCYGGYGGCSGCYGGGYGGCSGCYGGGYGGCSGCYGGGYGGCSGCYGGGYGCAGGCYGCYGSYVWNCHGCYGGWSGYGMAPAMSPYHMTPMVPGSGKPAAEEVPPPKKSNDKDETSTNRARLIVEVPADAKLYIDGQQMKTPSGRRVFNTPPLQPGQSYYYVLRAEVVRDGQRQVSEQRVIVRPGQEARAAFTNLNGPGTATVQVGGR